MANCARTSEVAPSAIPPHSASPIPSQYSGSIDVHLRSGTISPSKVGHACERALMTAVESTDLGQSADQPDMALFTSPKTTWVLRLGFV